MKLTQRITNLIHRYLYLGVMLAAAGCFTLLLLSYVFPKYAYDITEYHVIKEEGETEELLELSPGTVISYQLDVDGDAINGIEPCFDWGSDQYPEGQVYMTAWHSDGYPEEDAFISESAVTLDSSLRTAYAYIAMPNQAELSGDLIFTIRYELPESGDNGIYPAVVATDRDLEDSATYINGIEYQGDLLMYYVSTIKTYPLVFDARMCLLALLAVLCTMTRQNGKKKQVQKEESVYED